MQYNDQRGRPGALAVGAVVGALLAGAAVGVLAAPESGAGTRRRIRRGVADLGGYRLRDRWDDLSTGFEQRRRGHKRDALVERLEARIEAMEERLAEIEAEPDVELDPEEEVEHASGSSAGSVLGLAASALLTWLLASDKAAPAREKARDVAGRAREQATTQWEKFKEKRGAYQRTGDHVTPEGAGRAGGQGYQ